MRRDSKPTTRGKFRTTRWLERSVPATRPHVT